MSNKIVPSIYRHIIDDVMNSIQPDFEEYGMDEEVWMTLQAKWEAKLLESRVADFIQAAPPDDVESDPEAPLAAASNGANGANGNQRPASLDNEPFGYSGAIAAGQPGLALPIQPTRPPGLVLPGMQNGQGYGQGVQVKQEEDPMRIRGGAPSDIGDIKPKAEPNAAGLLPGDEVIDSDLDDSDDEGHGEAEGVEDAAGMDIVFCVYDKVARVKNKWKATFKDGLVHINGRDYLFTKCMGEFEW